MGVRRDLSGIMPIAGAGKKQSIRHRWGPLFRQKACAHPEKGKWSQAAAGRPIRRTSLRSSTARIRKLAINLHITQYQKAPTFAVSCEWLKQHTYQKGAPL